MTGGQVSPTTPAEGRTKTSPYGNGEQPFDVPALVTAAGATFVAREIAVAPKRIERAIEQAVAHKGFSFVEIMTQCPTQAGRNIFGTGAPKDIYHALKRAAVAKEDLALEPGQFRVGVLHHDTVKKPYSPPQC
jgi:2-oxoglutarate ferredoxin oxidoreductase subunit beta